MAVMTVTQPLCAPNKERFDVSFPQSEIPTNLKEEAKLRLEKLRKARHVPGNFDVPFDFPAWYDDKKFCQGQKFFQDHFFCVVLAHLMGVLVVLSSPRILKPLIFTGKSDTAYAALKRYASTIRVVLAWYEGNIWDRNNRGRKSLEYVRKSHSFAAKLSNGERKVVVDTTETPVTDKIKSRNLYDSVRKDLESYSRKCVAEELACPYINQWDLIIVQYAFVGSLVTHPRSFGIIDACDSDIEGVVHFWRVVGYLMGIHDEYNLCSGTVSEIKSFLIHIEQEVILPYFSTVDRNFEHMGTALMEGMNMMVPFINYPCTLLYKIKSLGGSTETLHQKFSTMEKVVYRLLCSIIYSLQFSPIRRLFKYLFKIGLELIEGRGPWWWPRVFTPKNTIAPSLYR